MEKKNVRQQKPCVNQDIAQTSSSVSAKMQAGRQLEFVEMNFSLCILNVDALKNCDKF